ncbi:hypothetical protein KRR38_23550 [Novosphingobium sp. G106]|uniref:hypothetical protein n=1 Tax=Novosphingobium sp. G106 TaxID=2849500 RepID=UPI001C2D169B|nr:hypothetical protein [Novosphingobium sp. G106]MBV1690569.1 hypothetical protein [Novosphingobium sp. G106]
MNSIPRLAALAALAASSLALAACKGEKKPAEAGTAQGEILQGSVSDSMLPLDTVRSQPPLAPEAISSGQPGKKSTHGVASGEASEAASEAAEAPAAAPSPVAAAAPTPTAKPAQ